MKFIIKTIFEDQPFKSTNFWRGYLPVDLFPNHDHHCFILHTFMQPNELRIINFHDSILYTTQFEVDLISAFRNVGIEILKFTEIVEL